MQLDFTEDQQQFGEVVARFLRDKSPTTEVRKLMASPEGYDPDVWRQLGGELGLCGTHLPEAYGGFGFGPVELGIVAQEMGKRLYCGPYLASAVMAGYALLLGAESSHCESLLPQIASGDAIATLALSDVNAPPSRDCDIKANGDALTGTAPLVLDAHVATMLVVIAAKDNDLALYIVAPDASGVTVAPQQALDPTRKLCAVTFEQASAEQIGRLDDAAVNALWDHICTFLAHEMIGGAEHLLESTVEYTKLRYQFGRPIGSFQGLKHRCADLLMEVELAKAATHHAARCLAAGEGEAYAPSMAKAMAADVYMKAAKEAIQMRGGIGFTWEDDTHLWYKRAKSSEVFMGTPAMHRERMMTMIEQEGAAA